MLLLKKTSNALATIVHSRRVMFASYDSHVACVRIAAVVLAAAALSGVAEGATTVNGDVWSSEPPPPPDSTDPWLGNFFVGRTSVGSMVLDGSEVFSGFVDIGDGLTGQGSVSVLGGELTTSIRFLVGDEGRGELQVNSGGAVHSVGGTDVFTGLRGWGAVIGDRRESHGIAFVSGEGSSWVNDGLMVIGEFGEGELFVLDGAYVELRGDPVQAGSILVADNDLSEGRVLVANATLQVSDLLVVGDDGIGQLQMEQGGVVYDDYAYVGWGESDRSEGHVNVAGEGTRWTNWEELRIGFSSNGSLEIAEKGYVWAKVGAVGQTSSGNGTVTISGTGSEWAVESSLDIGFFGEGDVQVRSGARLSSGVSTVGYRLGSEGNVVVSGAGSHWDTFNLLRIGWEGTGTLQIENGGNVSSTHDVLIASGVDSVGEVTVTGQNSKLHGRAIFISDGTGTLTVEDGATVSSTSLLIVGTDPNSIATVAINRGGRVDAGSRMSVIGKSRVELQPGSAAQLHIGAAPPVSPSTHSQVTIGSNNSLGLNGGTVQTEELYVTSSDTGRRQLNGNGYVTGLVSTLPQGTLAPIQGLRNAGTIAAQGDYRDAPDGWSSASGQAQLWFDGNYVQEANGKLELTVTEDNRTTASVPKIPVRISAHAHLDGKLQVSHDVVSAVQGTLAPGDSFHLMEWSSFTGRFKEFSGAVIPNNDDLFFGLQYAEQGLDLIALETPRRPQGFTRLTTNGVPNNNAATGIVFVTHGWASQAGSIGDTNGNQWKPGVALGESQSAGPNWEGVVFDWSPLADTVLPWEAARRAVDVGESVGFWMKEAGLQYVNAHVIGHSAGSWLADKLVSYLEQNGLVTNSHLTIVDAFTPDELKLVGRIVVSNQDIGASADWADHYVDFRNNYKGYSLQSTNVDLPNVFTLDVTMLDPKIRADLILPHRSLRRNIVVVNANVAALNQTAASEWHRWPGEFYAAALTNPDMAEFLQKIAAKTGFLGTQDGLYARPNIRAIFDPFGRVEFYERGQIEPVVALPANSVVSDTGTVTFDEQGGFELETGSPAFLTTFVELSTPASVLEFDFEFLADVESLLSVYVNGTLVYSFEQAWSQPGVMDSGEIWLEPLEPGIHTFLFRLDPYDASEQASIRITNIALSDYIRIAAVPEPASLTFAFLGLLLLLRFNRRSH